MEALEKETEDLTRERTELEAALSSGTLDADTIGKAGIRLNEVTARLDEAETRLLELMMIEE